MKSRECVDILENRTKYKVAVEEKQKTFWTIYKQEAVWKYRQRYQNRKVTYSQMAMLFEEMKRWVNSVKVIGEYDWIVPGHDDISFKEVFKVDQTEGQTLSRPEASETRMQEPEKEKIDNAVESISG